MGSPQAVRTGARGVSEAQRYRVDCRAPEVPRPSGSPQAITPAFGYPRVQFKG